MRGNRQNKRKTVKISRRCYPDGGSWLDQEVIVSEAFNVMTHEIREVVRRG